MKDQKIKDFQTFLKEEKKQPVFEFSCAMVYFDFPQMKEIHTKIDEADLYEGEKEDPRTYGLEKEPHITLLYGFHDDEVDPQEVMKICLSKKYSPLVLKNVSLFKNSVCEVLKFDVESEILHKINSELKEFPHESLFPDYHPHTTIAYLKPGTGDKYVKMFREEEHTVIPTKIVYTRPTEEPVSRPVEIEDM